MSDSQAFCADDDDVAALHAIVSRIAIGGYSEAAVCERLGLKDICDLSMHAIPIYRQQRLRLRDPLAVAIDLFLLQGCVPAGELGRLLDKDDCDVCSRTGIVAIDGAGVARALLSLFPVGNRLIFSDHAWPQLLKPENSPVPFDQVMFVGVDSRWLARATVRRPTGSCLDLCTGSGIQALCAASHAERVLAVDINSRAVFCTRFNAGIQGCRNLEALQGDLYGPAGAKKFDLITANPPFVPSPVDILGFRDGGRSGEDIQRRIVAGLPAHLAPGGIAQIVTEIGERDGEPLTDRVRQWLGDAAMDFHVLRLRIHPADAYATGHAHGETPGEFLESVGAWAENLKAQGFTRIVSVLLAFQWSDPSIGPPWCRVDEAYPPKQDAGAEIEAAFAAERLTRDPGLRTRLAGAHLARTGPIILKEGRVLGGDLPPTCAATLSGQAIAVEFPLDPIERDLLDTLDNPTDVPTLMKLAHRIGVSREVVQDSLVSLLRKRLLTLLES